MGLSLRQHLRNHAQLQSAGIPTSLGPSPFAPLPPPGPEDEPHRRNEAYYSTEKLIYELFDALPLACVVNGRYFCTTGGIPATSTRVSDLNSTVCRVIAGREDGIDFEKCCEVVFSDPMDDDDEARLGPTALFATNLERGLSHTFSYNAACRFLAANGLAAVVRANSFTTHRFSRATNLSGRPWHYQYSQNDVGYRLYRTNPTTRIPTVISIFSAPSFQSTNRNLAAFVELPASSSDSPSPSSASTASVSARGKQKAAKRLAVPPVATRTVSDEGAPLGGDDAADASGLVPDVSQRRRKGEEEEREENGEEQQQQQPTIAIRQFAASHNRPLQLPGTSANAFAWSIDLMSAHLASLCAALLSDTSYAPETMYVDGTEDTLYGFDGGAEATRSPLPLGSSAPPAVEAPSSSSSPSAPPPPSGFDQQPPLANEGEADVAVSPELKKKKRKKKKEAAFVQQKMPPPAAVRCDGAAPAPMTAAAQTARAAEALLEQYKRKLARLCVLVAEEGIPVESVRAAILPSGSRGASAANSPQNASLSFGNQSHSLNVGQRGGGW